MAFALSIRNTASEVRQIFFTTTCLITIATVIFNGGMTVPVLSLLKVKLKPCNFRLSSMYLFVQCSLINFLVILLRFLSALPKTTRKIITTCRRQPKANGRYFPDSPNRMRGRELLQFLLERLNLNRTRTKSARHHLLLDFGTGLTISL